MWSQFAKEEHAAIDAHEQSTLRLLIDAFRSFRTLHASVENEPAPNGRAPTVVL